MREKPLSKRTALVLDAHDSHALSAIRSLGRQGALVTAASPKPHSMGSASRYCRQVLRSPNPGTDPVAYAQWLLATLEREPFDSLLFFGEGSADVVAREGDAIRSRTGCLVPKYDTFLTAARKDRATRLAAAIGIPVPASHEIARLDDAVSLGERLTFPVIVKAVAGSGGHQVRFARRAEALVEAVRELMRSTHSAAQRCLVQEYIPGVGYGFTALTEGGEIIASFMHRRLAEHDIGRGRQLAHAATGAVSIDEPELRASGSALLHFLRWDGMAMVEFRRSHRDGRFYLLEVNPRFPGSLALAIAAGVDFPALYMQRAMGMPVVRWEPYRVGLRYHWLISKGVAEAVEEPIRYARNAVSSLRPDTRIDLCLLDPMPFVVQVREAAWWTREYWGARRPASSLRQGALGVRDWSRAAAAWIGRRRGYAPAVLAAAILITMRGFTYPRGDHRLDLAWEALCTCFGLLGLTIRAASIGFTTGDRRVEHSSTAVESFDTSGTYSIMRHPRHVGTMLMWLGIAIFPRVWWLPVLAIVAYFLHSHGIIAAESAALRRKHGQAYIDWAAVTPGFVPRFSLWRRPRGSFAFQRVLRREHFALFAFVACLTFLEVFGDLNITNHLSLDVGWAGVLGATGAMCATVSVVSPRTKSRQ